MKVEPIESWSSNDRCQFVILEHGMLVISEQIDRSQARTTALSAEETLDLLQFLQRFEGNIRSRIQAGEPPANEVERWHQRRRESEME